MKVSKLITIFWFSLSLSLTFAGIAQVFGSETTQILPKASYNPQTSYINVLEPIIIDSNEDFVQLEKDYEWCTGDGTEKNPYIIDDIHINAKEFNRTCMNIENTDVYFIIQNSRFENSMRNDIDGFYSSGICLMDVSNGKIINNNLSYNFHGIYISHCLDCEVLDNTFLNHHNISKGKAIMLFNGFNNYIARNDITNHYDGICAWNSVNNTIHQNTITNTLHNPETGLYFVDCNETTISENSLIGENGTYSAIEDIGGENNLFFNNVGFSSKGKSKGISLTNSHNNVIMGNVLIVLKYDTLISISYIFLYAGIIGICIGFVFFSFEKRFKTIKPLSNLSIV